MENEINNGDCFEVNVLNSKADDGVLPYIFNRENISYARPFVDGENLKTMIYLKGNANGLTIECGYDQFGMKLDRNFKIKRLLSGLSVEDFKKVQEFAAGLQKSNFKLLEE